MQENVDNCVLLYFQFVTTPPGLNERVSVCYICLPFFISPNKYWEHNTTQKGKDHLVMWYH